MLSLDDAALDEPQPNFQAAADYIGHAVTSDPNRYTSEQKLELYSLYKQATAGDCGTPKPGFLDFGGKAKW